MGRGCYFYFTEPDGGCIMSYVVASLLCAYTVGIITGVFLEHNRYERRISRQKEGNYDRSA